MSRYDKYIGQKFNSLLITKVWRDLDKKETMCECICDCGKTHITYLHKVRYGKIGSCGCLRGNIKHGKQHTRIYRIWQAMKNRCLNPNTANFEYYGKKGVSVCGEWINNFNAFYEWSINNGYTDELTIDRIDVSGNYEPNNCRWVTMKEQCNKNKTNIYQIKLHGEIYSLRDFVDIVGESYSKLQTRLYRGKCTIRDIEEEYNSKGLYLNEYQKKAMTTCMPSSSNPLYMLFMLGEEIGELQGKFSKAIRKGKIKFDGDNDYIFTNNTTQAEIEEWEDLVAKECGDILWGVAGICTVMGWKLDNIGQINLDKLATRKASGTIDGNGDNR